MAFNIVGLMHRKILKMSEKCSIYADLTGRWSSVVNVHSLLKNLYSNLSEESNIKKTLFLEEQFDSQSQLQSQSQSQSQQSTDSSNVQRRSNMRFEYPKLKDYNELPHNPQLRQLIDLESVVVITGFGETSPWG